VSMMSFKRLAKQVRALFPSKLPQGATAFEAWITEFEEIYDLPTKDQDSIRFAVAAMIINLGTTTAYKSKFYFYLSICSGVAKQVAGAVFHEIKTRQLAEQKKAQSNGQPTT